MEKKKIAFQTSIDPMKTYIRTRIETYPGELWEEFIKDVKTRYGRKADIYGAGRRLEESKQTTQESTRIFSDRLLMLAKEAYTEEEMASGIIQRQLVNIFIDGLREDRIKSKIIRESPLTLDQAVQIAEKEEGMLLQIAERLGRDIRQEEPMEINTFKRTQVEQRRGGAEGAYRPVGGKQIICYTCGGRGHIARVCATGRDYNAQRGGRGYNPQGYNREYNSRGYSGEYYRRGGRGNYQGEERPTH
jgi:hypothetical protein